MPSLKPYRIGIDIGGTFTDLTLLDDRDGASTIVKVLTTPDDPARAVQAALRTALGEAGISADAVANVVHGTTLVTNALIERKGARTASISTAGFRDTLEIARECRYDMYDLGMELPKPLVPRDRRYEVSERVLADGSIDRPLDEADLDALLAEFERQDVEAVAVSLLHAYQNPAHERAIQRFLEERAPHLRVSISSEVSPQIREYERASTTAANVYVRPLVERYLEDFQSRLRELGFGGRLYMFIMLSSGGICTVDTAVRFPIHLIESGPAAGVLAAARFGEATGLDSLLSFDMGGTTAKLAVVDNGRPLTATEFEVARVYRFKRGSGLPVRIPSVELIEIGAGGGSIARVDNLGLLKVGPESAGADPGPACYGQGGAQPTVTDADLALGYLDPDFFLGGKMRLDRAAAERSLRTVGDRLGLDLVETAWGIHQVVNENMANAARVHLVERGKDPRRYPIFAFGGAGPVHAARVAAILGSPEVIIPLGAGVASTTGFLAAPLAFDLIRTSLHDAERLDWAEIDRLLDELAADGRAVLESAAIDPNEIRLEWTCEMRYRGQGHEITVPVPREGTPEERRAQLRANFETVYQTLYGRLAPDMPTEILTWRVYVSGPRPDYQSQVASPASRVTTSPNDDSRLATRDLRLRKGSRPAYFPEANGYVETPVYDRYALTPGFECSGPAIIEERESTIIVPPGARVSVDDQLAVRLAIQPGAPTARRTEEIDPITLEVIWNRLISVCNEQARALIRTSFTPILREAEDLSAGIFDSHGRMLAQAVTGTPGHINSMADCIPKLLKVYPLETIQPGDVFIANDPDITSGHLPDLLVATPVFRRAGPEPGAQDQLIGWFASICHCYDIGGIPYSAMARDIYEEGLFLPPLKLFVAGQRNEDLFRLIRANVRAPREVEGDLYAQVAGNAVGGRRLTEFLDEFGLPVIDPLAEAIIDRSEKAVRAAIAAAPDGRYTSELWADGFDEPIRIACQLDIRGDEVAVDFAGSSPRSRYGINVVLNYTQAYTIYGVKCALCPEVPNNEGSFRPIRVTAPPNSILNAQPPAPVAARHTIGHFLAPAVFAAIGAALPERVIANGSDALWGFTVFGEDAQGKSWSYHHLAAGGMGARPNKDGLTATSFPSRLAVIPVEMMETLAPIKALRKEIRVDSGGPGRFRGGCGQTLEFTILGDRPFTFSPIVERTQFPALGLAGGLSGAPGGLDYSGGRKTRPKETVVLPPGAVITLDFPGGGGFWPPFERDPAAVLEDVRLGLVTPEQAEAAYGVILRSNGHGLAVDEAATRRRREAAGSRQ